MHRALISVHVHMYGLHTNLASHENTIYMNKFMYYAFSIDAGQIFRYEHTCRCFKSFDNDPVGEMKSSLQSNLVLMQINFFFIL